MTRRYIAMIITPAKSVIPVMFESSESPSELFKIENRAKIAERIGLKLEAEDVFKVRFAPFQHPHPIKLHQGV